MNLLNRTKLPVSLFLTAFFLASCGGGGGGGSSQPAKIEITVDPDIAPVAESLPGFGGVVERPVGTLKSPDGTVAKFVANELWLSTDDQSELDEILNRWNGEIIQELKLRDQGLEFPNQYLIRVETTAADTTAFAADLRKIGTEAGLEADLEASVSSQQGLGVLAASAAEAESGKNIGVNWVGEAQDLSNGITVEAPQRGVGGGISATYNSNSASWPTHNSGSVQDIGVDKAWRLLAITNRLTNRINLAIIDQGFAITDDVAPLRGTQSLIPTQSALNEPNLFDCSTGSSCPWHGTLVASAAMAIPDNGFGSAGPAGPVANPIYISATGDMFMSMAAIAGAIRPPKSARIVNMSYNVEVPAVLSFSVLPFEAYTAFVGNLSNVLLFASAGNKNQDVDGRRSLLFGLTSYEKTWHTPCENAGVICVGGIETNSRSRADGSNYGNEQVDIFAPYRVLVGPDPDNTANEARLKNGTSYSSPFVAGVAALIWAADPSLSADRVKQILFDTAHSSDDEKVRRIVNAGAAVQSVIGNTPPEITGIGDSTPSSPRIFELNVPVRFSPSVTDFEDGNSCCEVSWSLNGSSLGTGLTKEITNSQLGPATLIIRAADSEGLETTRRIFVNVVNTPPDVVISFPSNNAVVFRDTSVRLRGSATDRDASNSGSSLLPCEQLEWTSNRAGDTDFPVTGCEPSVRFSSLGERTLTLTASDAIGASSVASVNVLVEEPPVNLPPVVNITSPVSDQFFDETTLSATASDPEGDTDLTYSWSVNVSGNVTFIGEGNNLAWTMERDLFDSGEGIYEVRIILNVTDSAGSTGTDIVQVADAIIID